MKYALAAIAVTLTAAGLSRPEFAGRAIQLLVMCTAFVVVVVVLRQKWDDLDAQVMTAFVPPEPQTTSGVATPDVAELVRSVEASDGRIPPPIAKHVAEACRGRLADRHRLYFHSDLDREAIASLVSPTMWTLLGTRPDDTIDVPISKLSQLLDEVDAL